MYSLDKAGWAPLLVESYITMDIDDALREVGGYRRWHLAAFACLSLVVAIPLASQGLSIVFIGKYIL